MFSRWPRPRASRQYALVVNPLAAAFEVIERHSGKAHFAGPRDEQVVAEAEAVLGVRFPPSYRTFVLRFGAGSIGAHEFYGVINTRFSGGVPDGVWLTLSDRAGPSELPRTMIAIGDDGMGGTYVLDTAKALEPPVEVWNGGASRPGEPLEQLAPNFATFLLDAVQREVATGH